MIIECYRITCEVWEYTFFFPEKNKSVSYSQFRCSCVVTVRCKGDEKNLHDATDRQSNGKFFVFFEQSNCTRSRMEKSSILLCLCKNRAV